MKTYIGFLRGINVGGHRPVRMARLREVLTKAGLEGVRTYVQSGNLVFRSPNQDRKFLEQTLEAQLEAAFGFEIPVLLRTSEEVGTLLEENPFSERIASQPGGMYYVLWKEEPLHGLEARLTQGRYPGQLWKLGKTGVYLWCETGYGNARLNNNELERQGPMLATTRNHNTLSRLLAMAGE